jgi:hypothetical protein
MEVKNQQDSQEKRGTCCCGSRSIRKKYETELIQRGIKQYKKLAVVFKGKEVTVKEG